VFPGEGKGKNKSGRQHPAGGEKRAATLESCSQRTGSNTFSTFLPSRGRKKNNTGGEERREEKGEGLGKNVLSCILS